jgi:hypothetical protein
VPRPPSFEQLPAVRRNARKGTPAETEAVLKAAANFVLRDVNFYLPAIDAATTASEVTPANVCLPPGNRVAVPFGSPRADGQAKLFMTTTLTWPPAGGCNRPDGTPFPSPFANGAATSRSSGSCSGNTISSGVVLFAAHCMSPTDVRLQLLEDLRANSGYPANADPCNIGTTYTYVLNDIVVSRQPEAAVEYC